MSKSETMAQAVGRRLRAAREAQGISQAEFTRRMRFEHQSKVNNWETGDAMVPPTEIPKIHLVLGIDSNYLYQDDGSRLPQDLYVKLYPAPEKHSA